MTPHLPLTTKESARLYWELSRMGARSSGEKKPWKYQNLSAEEMITLSFLQARYDPRLMSVLVDFLLTHQPNLNPLIMKELLRRYDALPIAAVIGEYIQESGTSASADFFAYLTTGVKPVPLQLFYKNVYPIGGHLMQETLSKSLWAFKKWGFLASDPPLLKETKATPYLYDKPARLNILREMVKEQNNFRLRDYLKAIRHSISRQQALKDIEALQGIQPIGKNKGRHYKLAHA